MALVYLKTRKTPANENVARVKDKFYVKRMLNNARMAHLYQEIAAIIVNDNNVHRIKIRTSAIRKLRYVQMVLG